MELTQKCTSNTDITNLIMPVLKQHCKVLTEAKQRGPVPGHALGSEKQVEDGSGLWLHLCESEALWPKCLHMTHMYLFYDCGIIRTTGMQQNWCIALLDAPASSIIRPVWM